jgi:UDP-N-acetylglucosamine transferase subunit ALG13
MSAPGKTLLVTVGSTQFPDLSDAALAEPTLAGLRAAGVTSLIVQLGFAPIPAHIAAVVGREGGRGEVGGLQLNVMRYTGSPGEMDALMRAADGVVSHAGGF